MEKEEKTMIQAIVNGKLVFPDEIRDGVILIEDGKILASGDVIPPKDAELIDAEGLYVGPGLVDEHNHGYINVKTGEAWTSMRDPVGAAREHLKFGTTSITPSVSYGCTMEDFHVCIHACKKAMAEGDTSIIGIHFEGPFTNPKYGAKADAAWKYSREARDEIFDLAGDAVLHCTYAPELEHAVELEDFLRERGIVMDLGHTEMNIEQCERAVSKGARIITHLFDAMGDWKNQPSSLQIQEASSLAALSCKGLYYELIVDSRGVHVKPHAVRLAYRTAGEDYIILVTDSTAVATYHDPSKYPPESPKSAEDLNYNDRGQLSGSRLVLSKACQNFMKFTGADVRVAFKCASTNPAKALRVDSRVGSILPGRDANLLFVDGAFNVKRIYFRGRRL